MIFRSIFPAYSILVLSELHQSKADLCGAPLKKGLQLTSKIVCEPLGDHPIPSLDGDLVDWAGIAEHKLQLTSAMGAMPYASGDLSMRCSYDDTRIYMAFEVPGRFRFNTTDDHLCASMSTMWRVGDDATFSNMGGCPHAHYGSSCNGVVPDACLPYRVDLGGHWELSTTEMGLEYGTDLTSGTGNDPIANKDDEWAVNPYCRPDDNDGLAANEWAGAWAHTNAYGLQESDGSYIFEMSRLLSTASDVTDVQLEEGSTYDFGFAFWDPFETQDQGWSKAGHYITGCSRDWIPLELALENNDQDTSSSITKGNEVKSLLSVISLALLYVLV